MPSASPRPWRVFGFYSVLDSNDETVIDDVQSESETFEHDEANLDHIVRCVNAHEALVGALEGIVAWADDYHGKPHSWCHIPQVDLCRAALSQAKGD